MTGVMGLLGVALRLRTIYGGARAALRGPLGAALLATVAALVLVGAVGLGLAWVRKDARRDEIAACDLRRHAADLAALRAEAAAHRRAAEGYVEELRVRRERTDRADADIARLEGEKEALRAEVAAAAGARDIALPDDRWLRQGAAGAGAGGAGRR